MCPFRQMKYSYVLADNSVARNYRGSKNMKPNKSIILILIAISLLLLQFGCEEQLASQHKQPDWFNEMSWRTGPISQPVSARPAAKGAPKITFNKSVHNFGNISPASTHICEFNFTNTGNDVLEILEVEQTCGCTPFVLEKKEYAPGEKGALKVGFYSDTQLGSTIKPLYIYSNDETNPEIELAIKANVIAKVDYEPKALKLLMMRPNADCPAITIKSLDNQPFSIQSFKSTSNCITVDYNPSVKARQFVLQPKVDTQKLAQVSAGRFEIGLSHPDTKTVSGTFDAPPRFSTSPRSITIHQADSRQATIKKVRVISNYDEDFEIGTTSSQNGNIKVLNQTKIRNGYELELQITPSTTTETSRIFTDVFSLDLKGAGRLEVACNGFLPGATKSPRITKKDKECKTCKPHMFDPKTFKEL